MNEIRTSSEPATNFTQTVENSRSQSPAETLRLSIRDFIKPKLDNDYHNYRSYDELATTLSFTDFRKAGLLTLLNMQFNGNISDALRFAYPNLYKKPVLDLDKYNPQNNQQQAWRAREAEIESQITQSMGRNRNRHLYFLKDTNQVSEKDNLGNRRDKSKKKFAVNRISERYIEKRDFEDWMTRENREFGRVIGRFIKQGDRVTSFLSGHDPVLPSLILDKVGEKGQLKIISNDAYFKIGLANALFNFMVDAQTMKGESKTRGQKLRMEKINKLSGADRISQDFRNRARNLLYSKLRENISTFYEDETWQTNVLMNEVFEEFNIQALRFFSSEIPSEIKASSQDAIVEKNRFIEIPDEDKEAILYELDRVLKPGGYLIIMDSARQQTLIEYYGEELFTQKYTKIKLRGINSGQIVVYQKLTSSKQNEQDLEAKKDKEYTIEELSTSVSLEDGTSESNEGLVSKSITPETSKSSYNVEDLARELGVSVKDIQKTLKSAGIRSIRKTSSSGRGESSRLTRARKLAFSPYEYPVIRDAVKRELKGDHDVK